MAPITRERIATECQRLADSLQENSRVLLRQHEISSDNGVHTVTLRLLCLGVDDFLLMTKRYTISSESDMEFFKDERWQMHNFCVRFYPK